MQLFLDNEDDVSRYNVGTLNRKQGVWVGGHEFTGCLTLATFRPGPKEEVQSEKAEAGILANNFFSNSAATV